MYQNFQTFEFWCERVMLNLFQHLIQFCHKLQIQNQVQDDYGAKNVRVWS